MPAELDEITRKVFRLEIEDAGAGQGGRPGEQSPARPSCARELADLRAQADAMRAQWEAERQAIRRVQELRAELERVRHEVEEAERSYDLNRAAELRYGQLAELERRLQAEEERLSAKQGERRLLREVVTDEEIAEIVSPWTGIPVARLQESEREKLLRLDEVLHERVVGQDEAVQAGGGRPDPGPVGHQGPAPADRLVHLPRPDRRRARPSWPARSPRRCSTPRRTSSGST